MDPIGRTFRPYVSKGRTKNFSPISDHSFSMTLMSEYFAGNCLTFHSSTQDGLALSVNIVKIMSSRRSQTLLVRILNSASTLETDHMLAVNNEVVAKIYDPRYYTVRGDEWADSSSTYMDYLYNNEVTAYRRIDELQGKSIPRFLGEFSHRTAAGGVVHLLLLEYICVDPLRSVEHLGIDEKIRLRKEADSILAVLRSHGVSHNDLHPGNVLWDCQSGLWVIDFADATFDNEQGFLRDKGFLGALVTPVEERRNQAAKVLTTVSLSVQK